MTVLETKRLRLRRAGAADLEVVARWNADPDVARHLAGVPDRARSDGAFARSEAHWQEHGFGLHELVPTESGELRVHALDGDAVDVVAPR